MLSGTLREHLFCGGKKIVKIAHMSSFDEMDAFEGASLSARAMAARPTPYLDDLNPAQREAVERLDGPVLMLAGAGTGKTKALTSRIVHLLNTGSARPNEILSVTFTNKAAREMKERVGRSLGQAVEGMPWMGTFHSICVKLLRRHAELISIPGAEVAKTTKHDDVPDPYDQGPVPQPPGPVQSSTSATHLKSNFTILDTDDQIRLLKQLIQAEGIEPDILVERAKVTAYDSSQRIREKDLSGHLDNGNGKAGNKTADKAVDNELLETDNQLYEALTLLKGLNVLGMRSDRQRDESGDS